MRCTSCQTPATSHLDAGASPAHAEAAKRQSIQDRKDCVCLVCLLCCCFESDYTGHVGAKARATPGVHIRSTSAQSCRSRADHDGSERAPAHNRGVRKQRHLGARRRTCAPFLAAYHQPVTGAACKSDVLCFLHTRNACALNHFAYALSGPRESGLHGSAQHGDDVYRGYTRQQKSRSAGKRAAELQAFTQASGCASVLVHDEEICVDSKSTGVPCHCRK